MNNATLSRDENPPRRAEEALLGIIEGPPERCGAIGHGRSRRRPMLMREQCASRLVGHTREGKVLEGEPQVADVTLAFVEDEG